MTKKYMPPKEWGYSSINEDACIPVLEEHFGAIQLEEGMGDEDNSWGPRPHLYGRHTTLKIKKKDGTVEDIEESFPKRNRPADQICVIRKFVKAAIEACEEGHGIFSSDKPDDIYSIKKNVVKIKGKKNQISYSLDLVV